MQLGVKLPHTGPTLETSSLSDHASRLEAAGFDSLWVGDHVVLPAAIASYYPSTAVRRATWPAAHTPYLETIVALAVAAASTTRVRLGTAVIVAAQRNPVLLAKQLAGVAHVSNGRLEVGVGAGWLREEFEALNAPFDRRGARMLEWIELMRTCWTGRPAEFAGENYYLPPDLFILPAPPTTIPVYVGGHSRRALQRAGTVGDGWLGQQFANELDPERLAGEVACVRAAATAAGRDPAGLRVILRIVNSASRAEHVAAHLNALAQAGVHEVIVETGPESGDAVADHSVLRDAADSV